MLRLNMTDSFRKVNYMTARELVRGLVTRCPEWAPHAENTFRFLLQDRSDDYREPWGVFPSSPTFVTVQESVNTYFSLGTLFDNGKVQEYGPETLKGKWLGFTNRLDKNYPLARLPREAVLDHRINELMTACVRTDFSLLAVVNRCYVDRDKSENTRTPVLIIPGAEGVGDISLWEREHTARMVRRKIAGVIPGYSEVYGNITMNPANS